MPNTWVLSLIVFSGVLASLELGYRLGRTEIQRGESATSRGLNAIEGAVFALLGLLLAFSFSGAATRFEARRHLITSEVNAIGTAWLRLDLLPLEAQPELRSLFKRYAELRATFFQAPLDESTFNTRQQSMVELQGMIWRGTLQSFQTSPGASQSPLVVLPALNSMFDIGTSRILAIQNHPPPIISTLLIGMTFLSATLAGCGMASNKTRNRFHRVLFALVMTFTIVVIADLEYPRRGLIRIDAADEALERLARSLNAPE